MECEFIAGDQVKLKPMNELLKIFKSLWETIGTIDQEFVKWHQDRINNIFTIRATQIFSTKHGDKTHLWLEEDNSYNVHWSEFFIPAINIKNNNNIPIIFGDMEYKQ